GAPMPEIRARLGDDIEVPAQRHAVLRGYHAFDDVYLAHRLHAHNVNFADAVVLRKLPRPRVAARIRTIRCDACGVTPESVQPHAPRGGRTLRFLLRHAGRDVQNIRDIAIGSG